MLDGPKNLACTDLRRVGAHPDHWYPLAWSHEVKPGKALGVRSPATDRAVCAARTASCSRWRTAAPTGKCPCTRAWWMAMRSAAAITAGPTTAAGAASTCPTSARAGCQTACAPIPAARPRAWSSSSPARRRWRRRGHCRRSAPSPTLPTRPGGFGKPIGCHYTFMHENLMDMNTSSCTGADGPNPARGSWDGGPGRAGWRSTTPSPAPAAGSRWASGSSSAASARAAGRTTVTR